MWKKKFICPYLKEVTEGVLCEDDNGEIKEYCKNIVPKTVDLQDTCLLHFPLEAVSTEKDYINKFLVILELKMTPEVCAFGRNMIRFV